MAETTAQKAAVKKAQARRSDEKNAGRSELLDGVINELLTAPEEQRQQFAEALGEDVLRSVSGPTLNKGGAKAERQARREEMRSAALKKRSTEEIRMMSLMSGGVSHGPRFEAKPPSHVVDTALENINVAVRANPEIVKKMNDHIQKRRREFECRHDEPTPAEVIGEAESLKWEMVEELDPAAVERYIEHIERWKDSWYAGEAGRPSQVGTVDVSTESGNTRQRVAIDVDAIEKQVQDGQVLTSGNPTSAATALNEV